MNQSDRDNWKPPQLRTPKNPAREKRPRKSTGEVVSLGTSQRDGEAIMPNTESSPFQQWRERIKQSSEVVAEERHLGAARVSPEGEILSKSGNHPSFLEAAAVSATETQIQEALQLFGLGDLKAFSVSADGRIVATEISGKERLVQVFRSGSDSELLFKGLLDLYEQE
jgi:hypothetical protein